MIESTQASQTICIEGAVTFSTVTEQLNVFFAALSGDDAALVHVDFSKVEAVNSAALAFMIEAKKAAERAGKSIKFISLPTRLLSLASVCGVSEMLALTHSD